MYQIYIILLYVYLIVSTMHAKNVTKKIEMSERPFESKRFNLALC